MFTASHSIICNASKMEIWEYYKNTDTWPIWDEGIDFVKLEGPFEKGTKGVLKPKGGPKIKFTILSVEPLVGFSDRSSLPLSKLDFIHTLEGKDGSVKITHTVKIYGILGWLFGIVIGKGIAKDFPETMNRLKKLVERG